MSRQSNRALTKLAPAVAVIVGAFTAAPFALAAPGKEAGCPGIDSGLAISVGANESEFRKNDAQVVLRGDVTIDQGVLHLAADEVTIEYLQGDTRDMGSQGRVNSLLARGTVKIVCENDRAHGGEAFYNVAGHTLQLTRDVLLVREDNILKGQSLFIDLDTGHMTIEGGGTQVTGEAAVASDTRIKAVFTPASPEKDEKAEQEETGPATNPETDPETDLETNPETEPGVDSDPGAEG